MVSTIDTIIAKFMVLGTNLEKRVLTAKARFRRPALSQTDSCQQVLRQTKSGLS